MTRVVKILCASSLCAALLAPTGCASGGRRSAPANGPAAAEEAAPAVAPQPSPVTPQRSAMPQSSAVAPQPTPVAPQPGPVMPQHSAVAPQPSPVTPASTVGATPAPSNIAADNPAGPKRISPQSVRQWLTSNNPPLLVCGYDNDEKCRNIAIEGAITYNQFLKRLDGLPQGREIIFYCA